MACEMCQSDHAPFKLSNTERGQELDKEFCCLSHLGAWLIQNLGSNVRSLLTILNTESGRKMAVHALVDKVLP